MWASDYGGEGRVSRVNVSFKFFLFLLYLGRRKGAPCFHPGIGQSSGDTLRDSIITLLFKYIKQIFKKKNPSGQLCDIVGKTAIYKPSIPYGPWLKSHLPYVPFLLQHPSDSTHHYYAYFLFFLIRLEILQGKKLS